MALVTLGPRMCKDKLMQAIGRMRQLETQRLLFAATQDVMDKVQAATSVLAILPAGAPGAPSKGV